MKNKARGFTLIEIMVVVVIIAILAGIAIPSYNSQLRKGRRADAQSFLMDLAQRQQQYLLDARTYALDPGAVTTLGSAVPVTVSDWYTVTVTPTTPTVPPTYILTATPIATKDQVKDGFLEVKSDGSKRRNLSGTDYPW